MFFLIKRCFLTFPTKKKKKYFFFFEFVEFVSFPFFSMYLLVSAAGSLGIIGFFLYKYFTTRQQASILPPTNNSIPLETKKRGVDHGVAELMGRRSTMEDASSMIPNIGGTGYSFYGVYDGHGGDKAARFLQDKLPFFVETLLKSEAENDTPRNEILAKAILQAEEEFMKIAREDQLQDGATIVCALVGERKVYVANVGDSEAILSRNGQFSLLTTVHTPARNEEEEARVKAEGGRVVRGRVGHPHFNPRCFNLAVSRAVGDLMYKSEEFVEGKNSGVVAVADTKVEEVGGGGEVLILACDGLWDVLEYQEVTNLADEWLQSGISAEETATNLVNGAFERGSRDNITACVVVLG